MSKVLITGCYGFIGSHVVLEFLKEGHEVIGLDGLTYAAKPDYLKNKLQTDYKTNQFHEVIMDIRDNESIKRLFEYYKPDHVIHLAAESHVCNSIKGPRLFYETNVMGTFNLIENFKNLHNAKKFIHVSTDEVYGDLKGTNEMFHEERRYLPTSPYSSSKAASDHVVNAYNHTYGVHTVITNCSNNFGPNQHSEKLIPNAISKIKKGEHVTLYGSGKQIRDWIFVWDHAKAIHHLWKQGVSGETYCVGTNNQRTNIDIVHEVFEAYCRLIDKKMPFKIKHTNDRPTDDQKYAIDPSKLMATGFTPYEGSFEQKLEETVRWYL